MKTPNINTFKKVVPVIYCYTTPGVSYHDGWCKIGQSEQESDMRVEQQTKTADIRTKLEWTKNATFDDGSGEIFRDSDFHAYLQKNGIERMKPQPGDKRQPEWFHISPSDAKHMLDDFRENRGILQKISGVIPYTLRNEQERAVEKAMDYFRGHENGKFLFNCKPRFGKTLTVYDLCKRMGLSNVLIVTNRPAIANSWYDDYCKFLGEPSGYEFVSDVDTLKGKPYVLSRSEFISENNALDDPHKCIEFVSLQDLKGAKLFGGQYDKLRHVAKMKWDILVIDEAHEGVDTYKTDVAFDHIDRKYTLHLSGTPFKALANGDFDDKAIFNWTYADEQSAKKNWDSSNGDPNPYATLPQLNMYTYQMSEIIKNELKQGIEIQGETEEYAFDLNEFFATDDHGHFIHNKAVDKFLDALVYGTKYPFSTPELRAELRHTLWLLNRVDSAKALEKKLKKHPVFGNGNYEIILAAGDGKTEEDEKVTEKAFDRVKDAIAHHDKTITLSVGQLTTGVTIPEWTAVLMLSNIKSEAQYMQAAFRAQNPCLFNTGKECFRKKNAYIFDFDPARTLIIFEKFANNLSEDTAAGHGDSETRKQHIRELLNFFPVIGEDENGEMVELDAAKVLSIPRKIKSTEVVRRGFMSNYLFQNISNIFNAPQEVLDTLQQMEPAKKEGPLQTVTPKTGSDLDVNQEGEVEIPKENVIGEANDLFGEKIYAPSQEDLSNSAEDAAKACTDNDTDDELKKQIDDLKSKFADTSQKILDAAKESYQGDLSDKTGSELKKQIDRSANTMLDKAADDYRIEKTRAEAERDEKLKQAETKEEEETAQKEFEDKMEQVRHDFQQTLSDGLQEQMKAAGNNIVERVEKDKKEKEKRNIEDDVRDHLRGFSRTIPSFLMAYGDDKTTLARFDKIIPDQVFQDVTSITLTQFRFLRDGGDYYERDENGEAVIDAEHKRHFEGHLFDEVVFDDSIKEFLNKKHQLADYFDEKNKEDIFDYIPPQKTNQIFTPRNIVIDMCDDLEKENPGCFDQDDKTFVDLYMKSGMYITEIVKRLYNSPRLKALYPDNKARLNHIFAKQVYGLAPTEIIYRICLSYILGFSDEIEIDKNNIRLCDALEYAKNGTLEMKLEELFPELKDRR